MFFEIMKLNHGAFFKSCKQFKIDPPTMKAIIAEDPTLQHVLALAKLERCEQVEDSLFTRAIDPKGAPVLNIFWLKNNHPRYREQRITTATQINVDFGGR